MDILLSKVTQQAMNYAIRSGITITSGYALRQCAKLLKTTKGTERDELAALQLRLESKIRIISPAIDMIELIAARGNTSLESAVTLTKALRWDIQALGVRLAKTVSEEELARRGSSRARSRAQHEYEVKQIMLDIKNLLDRIEDAVPLINLAITTSGVSLSTSLPQTVSPSRLLQASTFLTAADTQYGMTTSQAVQVGPTFVLSLYMLFSGHAYRPHDEDNIRETTWKEVIHKAQVKLMRVPLGKVNHVDPMSRAMSAQEQGYFESRIPGEGRALEYAYQIVLIEDLDDERVHTFEDGEEQPGRFQEVALAGIREVIPIHEISKIFYADTGKILNIGTEGETNNPVLLLKRDINAVPPRRMMEHQEALGCLADEEDDGPPHNARPSSQAPGDPDTEDELEAQIRRESSSDSGIEADAAMPQPEFASKWKFPPDLDPEWMALEVYTNEADSDDDIDAELELETSSVQSTSPRPPRLELGLTKSLSCLELQSSTPGGAGSRDGGGGIGSPSPSPALAMPPASGSTVRTSLSLLEMLIRLTSLQQFQQSSHLAINDELLSFFLEESSTHGASGDADTRRRVRRDARRRVGFDPYDESPIKRRGEEYQYGPDGHNYSREGTPARYGGEDSQYIRQKTPDMVYQSRELSSFRQQYSSPYSPIPPSPQSPYPSQRSGSSQPLDKPSTSDRTRLLSTAPVTPPASTKSRHTYMRNGAITASKPSPLGKPQAGEGDSAIRTSPSSERKST